MKNVKCLKSNWKWNFGNDINVKNNTVIWYCGRSCRGDKGDFSHFLAEVSNIPWNERHQYAHYVGNGAFTPDHPKEFHVSPFNDENQHYNWVLAKPGDTVSVQLNVSDERGHIFTAQLGLNRHPLNLQSVRARILRKPAMTMSIVAGIYWQAFNLFRKGVPYISYSNPGKRENEPG